MRNFILGSLGMMLKKITNLKVEKMIETTLALGQGQLD